MSSIGEESHQLLELCDLPDEILIRILSLLPTTKDAVQTCLLLFRGSGKQDLWKYLTSLQFHFCKMLPIKGSNFINFMERVMHIRDHSAPLVSFSLHFIIGEEGDADRIKTLVTMAVQCNVEHLTLCLYTEYSYFRRTRFPCCILGCQSLVELDLSGSTFDVPSSVVCLPRLKYLRFNKVTLVNDESTELSLSFPLLEDLAIENCSWYQIESICVSSPKLQMLNIFDDTLYGSYHSGTICIIGDNLKNFFYSGNLKNKFRICASSSRVAIYADEDMFGDLGLYCYDILNGFYGTPSLALSDYFLEGLQKNYELLDTVPIFKCVTRLDIRVDKEVISIDSLVLMKIYETCRHLEYLNIGKLSNTKGNPQLSPIPLCFQTSLKKILVHYYAPGDNKADAAIDVLLNSAPVLEQLVIYCDEANGFREGSRKIKKLQDSLNRRSRVSKNCIISVRVPRWSSFYQKCYLKSMSES